MESLCHSTSKAGKNSTLKIKGNTKGVMAFRRGWLHMHVRVLRKQTTMMDARWFGLFMMAGQAENKNSTLPLPQSTFHDTVKKSYPGDDPNSANQILIGSENDRTLGVCE